MLADGIYDAFVLDAEPLDDPGGADSTGGVRVELTITSGSSKGDVVSVRGSLGRRDPIDLLGVPATLEVVDGVPAVRFEG